MVVHHWWMVCSRRCTPLAVVFLWLSLARAIITKAASRQADTRRVGTQIFLSSGALGVALTLVATLPLTYSSALILPRSLATRSRCVNLAHCALAQEGAT